MKLDGWPTLFAAGCFEVVWAVAMAHSDGFRDVAMDAVVVAGMAASMYLLSKSLNAGIPVGTAYAVWVGIGAVGTLAFSFVTGMERLTPAKALLVSLVVGGIVGLQATSGPAEGGPD